MFTHVVEKFSCFGAFAKLRKATISFFMYVCLSVCLPACLSVLPSVRPTARLPACMEQLNSHWTDLHEIELIFFENMSRKFKFHYNLTKKRALYMKTNIHL